MNKKIDANELNWIGYLIGKIKEENLTPANHQRLDAQRERRQEIIAGGDVPLKPFGGGIVL